jgi:hypothetical protein
MFTSGKHKSLPCNSKYLGLDVVLPVVLVLVSLSVTAGTPSLASEVAWIVNAAFPSGPLAQSQIGYSNLISPYEANLAIKNVLTVSNTSNVTTMAENWIQWYLNHLNMPDQWGVYGTIYDYIVYQNGTEVSTNNCDSTDSYGATFLSLIRTYLEVTDNFLWISQLLEQLKIVANASLATFQETLNLTYAKPNYAAAYLMDNVEVWRGMTDFTFVLEIFNDSNSQYYNFMAERIRFGIETNLWNEATQDYFVAAGSSIPDWNVFYPDATANMWPMIFLLPEGLNLTRREFIYTTFMKYQGQAWLNLTADPFPWVVITEACEINNDNQTVSVYLANVVAKFFPAQAWPWSVPEASWFVRRLANINPLAQYPTLSPIFSPSAPLSPVPPPSSPPFFSPVPPPSSSPSASLTNFTSSPIMRTTPSILSATGHINFADIFVLWSVMCSFFCLVV